MQPALQIFVNMEKDKIGQLLTTDYTDSTDNRGTVIQSDGRTLISVIRDIRGKISSDMILEQSHLFYVFLPDISL